MDSNRKYASEIEARVNGSEEVMEENISIEQLRHLVHLLDRSDVAEVEVKREQTGTRLVLRKARVQEAAVVMASPVGVNNGAIPTQTDSKKSIVASLVGIFHAAAKPNGKPLVSVGDTIKIGQRVGTIQSLNVLSEVEASFAGKITEILIQDGMPVEYGQPLMTIESIEES